MAKVDVGHAEDEGNRSRKSQPKWWIWVIIAILAIIILWLAFDPRTDVQREQIPQTDTQAVLMKRGGTPAMACIIGYYPVAFKLRL